jgi:gamma-glutamylcyclotransferase (GGCT)/AIG2-like uncharacterized protein YtfP
MSEYLFAYGTLQPGCAPAEVAALAAKLLPVSAGFVRGVLYDLGRYPGAVPDANSQCRISGTVMKLPEDKTTLRQLDEYEGYDPQSPVASEFVRELQVVELNDGRKMDCWFYRYNRKTDEARIIASSKWRDALPES